MSLPALLSLIIITEECDTEELGMNAVREDEVLRPRFTPLRNAHITYSRVG